MDRELKKPLVKMVLPDTIEECHGVIKELYGMLLESNKIIRQLSARVEKLERENLALKERLALNSQNSSKPPSTDINTNKKKKSTRKSSGRSSGGQPGHAGTYRELLPTSEVDQVVTCCLDTKCSNCGVSAVEPNGSYVRHQVYELPEIKLNVIEYQLAKGQCGSCHHKQVAPLPDGVPTGITGSKLTGLMSSMVGDYSLSRRDLCRFLSDFFNFKLSLGSVFNKQRLVNQLLEKPVDDLLPEVKSQNCHMDETGHNRDGERQWLWAMASSQAAYFKITPSRGKKVAKQLLTGFRNILTTDRYSAYNMVDSSRHQLCWAHLKRDFTKFSERKDPIVRRIGKELLDLESQLFSIWHDFKESKITRNTLMEKSKRIRKSVGEALEKGSYTAPELRLSGFCKNILKEFFALWTFLEEEDVEPTNNHGERMLRPWVIWRKKYFSTRSDYGTEFVARFASVKMTCKLQSTNVFSYLANAVESHFFGRPAPPVIPSD